MSTVGLWQKGHSLSASDVAEAIVGSDNVTLFNAWHEAEEDFEHSPNGDTKYKGAVIWVNGKGCPEQYPLPM